MKKHVVILYHFPAPFSSGEKGNPFHPAAKSKSKNVSQNPVLYSNCTIPCLSLSMSLSSLALSSKNRIDPATPVMAGAIELFLPFKKSTPIRQLQR